MIHLLKDKHMPVCFAEGGVFKRCAAFSVTLFMLIKKIHHLSETHLYQVEKNKLEHSENKTL